MSNKERVYSDKDIIRLAEQKIGSLRQRSIQYKEVIRELLIIAGLYESLPQQNKISKTATKKAIDRAKSLLGKPDE